MKLRKKENGYVFEANDEAAPTLIARGDYEAYDEKTKKKATAVKPLTTADMPKQPKKGKK